MHPGPRRSILLALALTGATLLALPAAADEAEDHFAKANAAFQAEKYGEALTEYQAAYKLNKSPEAAALMGITEMRLEKYRDAAEHLAFALAHWPAGGDEDLRKNTEASLAEVKKAVVMIHIKTTTKTATFKINGGVIDASTLDTDVYFEPGKRVISASAPGYLSASRTVEGKAGDSEIVTINLTADTGTARGPVPGFVLGGVGLVGIVIGASLIAAGDGKKGDAEKLHSDILGVTKDNQACSSGSGDAAKCKALKDAASSADGLHNGGVAALVFGVVAGVAAGGYFLLPARKAPAAKVSVVPVAGPSTGGLLISGAF